MNIWINVERGGVSMLLLKQLTSNDMPCLQVLLEQCEEYLVFQDKKPLSAGAAEALLSDQPDDSYPQSKVVLGIYTTNQAELVGVFDLLEHYREYGTLSLVLLLIKPESRSQKLGSDAYHQLEAWAIGRQIRKIRLGVLFGNDQGVNFWRKMGFKDTGEIKPYLSNNFFVLEKYLYSG
jgi:ribosomal protein S18 acetylase RimI-like enzyme